MFYLYYTYCPVSVHKITVGYGTIVVYVMIVDVGSAAPSGN